MRAHSFFITLILFLLCLAGKTQDTLNRLYGTYEVETGKTGIVLSDSTIYAVGTSSAFISMSSQAYLIKLDKQGSILWSKFYGGSGVDDAMDMFFDVDSSIYIVCNSYNGPAKGYDVKIIKVDNDGNLQWEKAFGTSEWDVPAKILKCDLGTYMVCGYTYGGTGAMKDGMLFKFTDAGDSLQFSTFGGPTDDIFTDFMMRNTDTLVVCGITTGSNGKTRGWLLEQKISGGTIGDYKFGLAYNHQFNAITKSQFQHYLIGATTDSTAGGDFSMVGKIIERNTKATTLDFILGGSAEEHCTDILCFGGYNYILGNTKSYGYGGFDAVLYQFIDGYWSPRGGTWGTADDDYANSVVTNAIGYFTIFGTSQEMYGVSDLWVINCDTTYMQNTTVSSQLDVNGVQETNPNEFNVRVYPNPFSQGVTVSSPKAIVRICINDCSGKQVGVFENTAQPELSSLANGIYFMTVFVKDAIPLTIRIVKG